MKLSTVLLVNHLGYYIDVRKRIPLVTRLGLAIMRQNLIKLQHLYIAYKDTGFYRSIERVITLIDTVHNKGNAKIASANYDFIAYLDGLAVKCGKTNFITTNDCQKYIIAIKEYFSWEKDNNAEELLKELKKLICEDIREGTTSWRLPAEAYFADKSLAELDINSTDNTVRIRAKWLKPQLTYYYNQLTNPFIRENEATTKSKL